MIHLSTDHNEYFSGYPGDMLTIPADQGYSPMSMAEALLSEANTMELSVSQLRQVYRVVLGLLWEETDDSVQAELWPAVMDEDGEPHPYWYHFFGFADEDGQYGWDTIEEEPVEGFPKVVYDLRIIHRPDIPGYAMPTWASFPDHTIPGLVQLRVSFYRTHVVALAEEGGSHD